MTDSNPNQNGHSAAGSRKRESGFKRRLAIGVVLSGFLLAGLGIFGAIIWLWVENSRMADEPSIATPVPGAATPPAGDEADGAQQQAATQPTDDPVSLLPAPAENGKPDDERASQETPGVSVLVKQPDAPAAEPSDLALLPTNPALPTGFAIDLGAALSFVELSQRFGSIVALNGEENFMRLEPRAVFRETSDGLEARLLVGPFASENAANEACDVLILPDGFGCEAASFEGELIARE